MTSLKDRTCLECNASIHGRVDKKFCSDLCRNVYHNRLHSARNNYMKKVNLILARNRRILSDLNPGGKVKVSREHLRYCGFNFNYYTSTLITKRGPCFYCYDQGYVPVDRDYLLLVTHKDLPLSL